MDLIFNSIKKAKEKGPISSHPKIEGGGGNRKYHTFCIYIQSFNIFPVIKSYEEKQ